MSVAFTFCLLIAVVIVDLIVAWRRFHESGRSTSLSSGWTPSPTDSTKSPSLARTLLKSPLSNPAVLVLGVVLLFKLVALER
jgi:hypothetical protein